MGHSMAGDGGWRSLLQVSQSTAIARRYFVTNGFDGTLAMLGLIMGFRTLEHNITGSDQN
jgi:hypothetical protein